VSTCGQRPAVGVWSPGCDQAPTAGRHLRRVGLVFFFLFNLIFFKFFIGSLGNGPRLLGEWMHSTPIFSSFPLHLEVSNLPFLIEFGDFFLEFFFLNLDYTWTFISTVRIFISWKIEITKNSTSFASVMENFCTPLQCRVHLSMFHSSSTSNT
jgi:hypothetical protein